MKVSHSKGQELMKTGKWIVTKLPVDPTLHCDNKCLRMGYCRFECDTYEAVKK